MPKDTLPIIDISPLYLNDEEATKKVALQIDDACRTWGFFYIVGHNIPTERVQKLTAYANRFFELPLEEKLKIDITKSKQHRGYGTTAAEQLDPSKPGDFKETFDMGCHLPQDHPDVVAGKTLRGSNNHPTQLEGWEELMERHYKDMQQVALKLLRALAIAIGLESDFFDSKFNEPLSVFRMIHYPPCPAEDKGVRVVAGEHTDYGIVTLLYQDTVGGLQVRNLEGEWLNAPPIEGSYVVNIGDMMAMWSNNRYKSTAHRVVAPGVDRISMPFFCEPNPDTVISCLPHCFSEENPARYPDVTAREWLTKRFAQTYKYRKETQ